MSALALGARLGHHHGTARYPNGPALGEPTVGLFRKMTSVSTLGMVDFRSDKERTAAYTKAAKKEAKKQTKIMRDQAKQQQGR